MAFRPAGNRLIEELFPLDVVGRRHLPYAWLAQAAYEKTPAAQEELSTCEDADNALKSDWVMWKSFPKDVYLASQIHRYHLRVEVWSRKSTSEVVIAFGGTIFNNKNDWLANLRWFIPKQDDQYSLVVRKVAKAFKDELASRIAAGEWEGRMPKLVATGHSLGGGLAQLLAYALPQPEDGLRVSRVYAFHPSPVTGYFTLDEALRDANTKGLEIERIYERGEILAMLRSAQNTIFKPSDSNPAITGYRYDLISTLNPIANHSIGNFACALATKLQQVKLDR